MMRMSDLLPDTEKLLNGKSVKNGNGVPYSNSREERPSYQDALSNYTPTVQAEERNNCHEDTPPPGGPSPPPLSISVKDQKWGQTSCVVLSSVAAAIGGLLFGYDVGIVSGAILQLRKPEVFDLSCIQQELVVSSMLLGAIVGSLFGGFMIDRFGRRTTIILNAAVFILGALTLALSPTYAFMIMGRIVVGFGVSVSAIGECIYISEIAPPTRRGLLVSLNELGITLGILLAYLVNFIFIDNVINGWRFMFGLSIFPAFIQAVAMGFLPSSPRYLMLIQRENEAEKTLQKIRGTLDVQAEISEIRNSIHAEKSHNVCELFSKVDNMRGRMLIGAGLVFFQQVTGQPNVLYYAPTIFKAVGFHSDTAATLATVGLGSVKVIATVISLSIVDRVGRRKLLIVGSFFMAVGTLSLGILADLDKGMLMKSTCHDEEMHHNLTFVNMSMANNSAWLTNSSQYFPSGSDLADGFHGDLSFDTNPTNLFTGLGVFISNSTNITTSGPFTTDLSSTVLTTPTPGGGELSSSVSRYLSMAALMVFCGAYGLSFGPVTWLILSEIFPPAIKGRAISLATVLNWGMNLIISSTFLNLMNVLGIFGTFTMYSGISCVAMLFIITFLPETKNRSLEQISEDLNNSSPGKKLALRWRICRCCANLGPKVKVSLTVPVSRHSGRYVKIPLTDQDTGVS